MALYHKWNVKNGFAYVLQFFSLISEDLGGVKCACFVYCTNRDNSPQDLYKLTLTQATAKIYEAETNMFAMAPYPHISSRCLSIGHLDWEKV